MFGSILKFNRTRRPQILETGRIEIKGMNVRGCERTIRKALLTKSGVKEVDLNRDTGVATIRFDPAQTDLHGLSEAIRRKGYLPVVIAE